MKLVTDHSSDLLTVGHSNSTHVSGCVVSGNYAVQFMGYYLPSGSETTNRDVWLTCVCIYYMYVWYPWGPPRPGAAQTL